MKTVIIKPLLSIALLLNLSNLFAGEIPDKDLRFNLNEDGSHYIKANFTAQIWTRYNENNPGTTVNGFVQNQTFDIGLRRVRTQLYGKITDKVFFYTQFGINNFTYNSARKTPLFFHDVLAEYQVVKRHLDMGMGLTGWTGLSRFSSPSIATIMTLDAPLFQQTTNDTNDQFLRKLSIYAKGKIGKLDYRVILSDPFIVDGSISTVKPLNTNSDFSYKTPKLQTSAYLMYPFLDEESNLTPYTTGTYLGKKKVFNLGAGVQYQPQAMWRLNNTNAKDTIYNDMLNMAIDAFYDHPIGHKGAAINVYATFTRLGFGPGYLRNIGAMNPGSGLISGTDNLNGTGNAVPTIGTGNVIQAQIGYLLPKNNVLGLNNGQLMPYILFSHSDFDRLNEAANTYNIGLNWFMEGHRSKISLDYQNRPVYRISDQKIDSRQGMLTLQFQIAI